MKKFMNETSLLTSVIFSTSAWSMVTRTLATAILCAGTIQTAEAARASGGVAARPVPPAPSVVPARPVPPAPILMVKAISYNVQFLSPSKHLKLPGHWPNTEDRARAIGRALACFDIVALNETVHDDRRRQIMQTMEQYAPACGRPSRLGGGKYFTSVKGPDIAGGIKVPGVVRFLKPNRSSPVVDDELTLVSRFPIIERHQKIFYHGKGEDALAAKGVLHARLIQGHGASVRQALDVFVTHLQAGKRKIRRKQLDELVDFVKRHTSPGVPFIILGDFNIDGMTAARRNPASEYNDMMRRLSVLGVRDLGLHLGSTSEGHRIDYFFVGGDLTAQLPRIEPFPHRRFGTLSDHAAVAANFNWKIKTGSDLAPLQQDKQLTVTVNRLKAWSKDSCNQFMDFYGHMSINDGQEVKRSFKVYEANEISPNWQLSKRIKGGVRTARVWIKIRDDDDVACGGGDDDVDINPDRRQKALRLAVNLQNGEIRAYDRDWRRLGKVVGRIGSPVELRGFNGKEVAGITFTVSVTGFRVSARVVGTR